MAGAQTRAILELLRRGEGGEVAADVFRVFGATSADECLRTYDAAGAAERASIDEAVRRRTRDAGSGFWIDVDTITAELAANEPEPAPAAAPVASVGAPAAERVIDDPYPYPPRRSGGVSRAYTIRRHAFSIGRRYSVFDPSGNREFKIVEKLRLAHTFSIRDPQGKVLYSIREKLLVLDATFFVTSAAGEKTIVKRTKIRDEKPDLFEITLPSGQLLQATGWLWHEDGIAIRRDGTRLATIHRQQLRVREMYSATVAPSADPALMLAIAMSIVEMCHRRGDIAT